MPGTWPNTTEWDSERLDLGDPVIRERLQEGVATPHGLIRSRQPGRGEIFM